jgi:hypothetical protein
VYFWENVSPTNALRPIDRRAPVSSPPANNHPGPTGSPYDMISHVTYFPSTNTPGLIDLRENDSLTNTPGRIDFCENISPSNALRPIDRRDPVSFPPANNHCGPTGSPHDMISHVTIFHDPPREHFSSIKM